MVFASDSLTHTVMSILKNNFDSHIRDPTKEEVANLQQIKETEEQTYKNLIVPIIASLLLQLLSKNESKSETCGVRTVFDSKEGIPPISIQNYLERIIQYAPCSPECFILALIYIDRLISGVHLLVTPLNIHRLLITCVMMASKLYDDVVYNNKHFSIVGGIEVSELNTLELALLDMLNFRLTVDSESFQSYQTLVEKLYAQINSSQTNGSATYEAIATSPVPQRKKAFQVFSALRRSKSCITIGFSIPRQPRLLSFGDASRSSSFHVENPLDPIE